jgi:hypothetical protein
LDEVTSETISRTHGEILCRVLDTDFRELHTSGQ